jgi:hypothetical protein
LFVLFAALLVDHRGSSWSSTPASQGARIAAGFVHVDLLSAAVQPDRYSITGGASEV